jgi:ferredoxin-NADP reductase
MLKDSGLKKPTGYKYVCTWFYYRRFSRNKYINGIPKIFYLCVPPTTMDAVEKHLANLKVDEKLIITEAF